MGWWPAMYVRAAFVCSFHQRLFVVVSVSERNRAAQSFETSRAKCTRHIQTVGISEYNTNSVVMCSVVVILRLTCQFLELSVLRDIIATSRKI
jgi:hypothetical protein